MHYAKCIGSRGQNRCNFSTEAQSHFQLRCTITLSSRERHTYVKLISWNWHLIIHFNWYKSALVSTSARLCCSSALVLLTITLYPTTYFLNDLLCNRCCKDSVVWALIDKETLYVYTHTFAWLCRETLLQVSFRQVILRGGSDLQQCESNLSRRPNISGASTSGVTYR